MGILEAFIVFIVSVLVNGTVLYMFLVALRNIERKKSKDEH